MRALSIRQPWIDLIFLGEKVEEYRSWKTNHTGDLILHASSTKTREVREDVEDEGLDLETLTFGALIGLVSVTGCTGEPGDYAWHLENPRRFKTPIPYKGAAGIFLVPDEVVARAVGSVGDASGAPKQRHDAQGEAMLALIDRTSEG